MGRIRDFFVNLFKRLFHTGTPPPSGSSPVNPRGGKHRSPSAFATFVASSMGQPAWAGLKAFAAALVGTGASFGPLKSAIDVFLGFVDNIEQAAASQAEYTSLRASIDALFHDLAGRFGEDNPPEMRPSIINLASGLEQEINFLRGKHMGPTFQNMAPTQQDIEEVLACYGRIHGHLERLTMNANFNIWMLVDKLSTDARLKNLGHAAAAWYSSEESKQVYRDECTPDTRLEVRERFRIWQDSDQVNRVYWLNGMAGTGKTTLAYTICKELEGEHRLAANFFCSRSIPTCREARSILPTIAYQLANFSYPFSCALSQILEKNSDVHTRRIEEQFSKLILEPVREAGRTMPNNLMVVIDGLDECSDQAAIGKILDLIFDHLADLPFKLLLASRPEPVIRIRMISRKTGKEKSEVHLHNLDQAIVQDDIKRFLQAGLLRANISPDDLKALVEKSGVLFIYAATVVRFVGELEFERGDSRLEMILRTSSASKGNEGALNNLYTLILDQSVAKLVEQEKAEAVLILHSAVFAKEPMTASTLAGFLGLHPARSVDPALNSFRSVLNIKQNNEGITILHKSFADYLLDPRRSGPFYCDQSDHHFKFAQRCLASINRSKPFNICNLTSSFVLDEDVLDMHKLVEQHISGYLLYSCRYWSSHLDVTTQAASLLGDIETFMSSRVLLWMEVINLTKHLGTTGTDALFWLKRWSLLPDSLREPATDAYEFHQAFSSSSASGSTPHIYVSTLQFWPEDRYISKQYRLYNQYFINETSSPLEDRSIAAPLMIYAIGAIVSCLVFSPSGAYVCTARSDATLRIWEVQTKQQVGQPLVGHTGVVYSVAYSPNGAYVCSGSADRTVRVWDAHTGQQVGEPIASYMGSVYSVAYSPDGARICSGSADRTVRFLDARVGQKVRQSIAGHTEAVYSVAYSPNGAHACSGSADRTIRVWDAHTGQQVGQPLVGHAGTVYSVAYSPDASRICSGSSDRTVRVWDAHNGRQVMRSHKGHTGTVYSVAYSPDGAHVSSGSTDHSVRVWNAHTGQPVGQPLAGHTGTVYSVACSPNGAHICSGSADHTVRIWDALTGQQVGQPAAGHTGAVRSVIYSPDGVHVCSGSADLTVRVWDPQTGQLVGQPIAGHIGAIYSVTYSPDGTHVCSGSVDRTIRIWDTHTGQQIGQPIVGHAEAVYSVAYSPDGVHVCSGSADRTVWVWDARARQQIGQPIASHTEAVYSVAYSPDGARACSGSADRTVRVWDAHTGQQVGQPLVGHTGTVYSVAYSPNDIHICSGSADHTVRVWDARTGQQIGQPLQGHAAAVYSIVYSPDGTHICSGSADQTVRVWDTRTRNKASKLLVDHTATVYSVGYSPDGTRICSGSTDGMFRIWDSRTSKDLFPPLRLLARITHLLNYAAQPSTCLNLTPQQRDTVPLADEDALGSSHHMVPDPFCPVCEGWTPQVLHAVEDFYASPRAAQFRPRPCGRKDRFITPKNRVLPSEPTAICQSLSNDSAICCSWELDEDGWIVLCSSRRLVWLPADVRERIWYPPGTTLDHAERLLLADLKLSMVGQNWQNRFIQAV